MDLENSLQRALRHLESGAPEKCLAVCNEILAESPGLIEAFYLRGCAAFNSGDIARSIEDLEAVHSDYPGHLHAAYYYGRALRAAGRFEEALPPLESALAEDKLSVPAGYELALCLVRLRRRPEAIERYRILTTRQPDNALFAANLASLLERENRLEEAESAAREALRLDPANETAIMTRAILDRRCGRYPDAAKRLRKLIPAVENPVNRSIAWNQLGQCLEGQEEWEAAFNAFSESNRILQRHDEGSHPDSRSPHSLQTLARINDWLKKRPMKDWGTPAGPDAGGIAFLVGFPRSGTTLLDRMLSAHPDIEVLEEKSLFSMLHQDWLEPGTLEAMADVNEAQIKDARQIYRREMSRYRQHTGRSLLIDKLPLNLAFLFLIYRLFPQAPVMFLKRHPMDVCISCFFQAFELQASMAYFLDIRQTAQYYDAVMQVATNSIDQVGNRIHSLRYEKLVAEPRKSLEVLLDFLALEWRDSVLNYWQRETGTTSNTPSYQQVYQPPHTRSIGKWRHYSKQLQPGLPFLQRWVKQFGYEEQRPANGGD